MTLAIRCDEFGLALNALACVVSYAVTNMPAHTKLLQKCVSRFGEISSRLSIRTNAGNTRAIPGSGTGTGSNEDGSRTPIQITQLTVPELHSQPNFVLTHSTDCLISSGEVNPLPLSNIVNVVCS